MPTLAVIGAGFCGTLTAVHLLRGLGARERPAHVVLLERTGRFTAGVAYATASTRHLLNVPAGRMSALPDEPDHFLRWARAQDPRIGGGSFVPRVLYGRYLAGLLEASAAAAPAHVRLTRLPRGAARIELDATAATIALEGGGTIVADHAVLAIGSVAGGDPPPPQPEFYRSWRYARDPWAPGALEVGPRDDVLLIGTGLTMLDIAIALEERGHQGVVHAISRRGLLPQPHRVSMRPPTPHARPASLDDWPATARGLLHAVRREVSTAAAAGVDWREVVTALRHDTSLLWQRLPESERARFLEHVRPYWETHRHRAAPETAVAISEMIAKGSLVVRAGRVLSCVEDDDGVDVQVVDRHRGTEAVVRVARVINCTGPESDVRRAEDPFVRHLLQAGLARADGLGLGLDTDDAGAVIDAKGGVHERLSLLGPLRRGRLWENTAVPELRVEARALGERLAALP